MSKRDPISAEVATRSRTAVASMRKVSDVIIKDEFRKKNPFPPEAIARAEKVLRDFPPMQDTIFKADRWVEYCAENNWPLTENPKAAPELTELYQEYLNFVKSTMLVATDAVQWLFFSSENNLDKTMPPHDYPEEMPNYVEWFILQRRLADEWLETNEKELFIKHMSALPINTDVMRRGARSARGKANKCASHIGYTGAPDLETFARKMRAHQSDPTDERRKHVSRIFPTWLVKNRNTGKLGTPSKRTIANKFTKARNAGLLPSVRVKKKKGTATR